MNDIKPQAEESHEKEVLLRENDRWLHFAEPQQMITAYTLDDVLPALQEIERLTQAEGRYAAGFLSYEAATAVDPALHTRASFAKHTAQEEFPYLWFGIYGPPRTVTLPPPRHAKETLDWQPAIDRETYNTAIQQIKEQIAAGRTYQANYTLRLQGDFRGSPWEFFLHLAQKQHNHAAYVDTGRYVIASASPELFFQLDGQAITCRPMKGTVERGRTNEEDRERAAWLERSEKNRAENVMIVDMIRNDLGRIAKLGSVHVPRLFETERYPTLWQMTSTVTAETNCSIVEILTALFPCASITGAPKVSTMEIIARLENMPRRVYTGSIGYIAPRRKATFNVAIRTAWIDRESGKAEYGVGGGIVWDSSQRDEYAEAMLKARVLVEPSPSFSLLETLLWTPEEGFFLQGKHLERILGSADYFDIPITKQKLEEYFEQISSSFQSTQRVRVVLRQDGTLDFEAKPFEPQANAPVLKICLAKQPVDTSNIFLFHKTTRREVYEVAREGLEDFDDVLLHNASGELTEFTLGNLVAELDGHFVTPPLACGLLPGTFRAHLLETGQVVERTIRVEQLNDCARFFRVNSVRKWQQTEL